MVTDSTIAIELALHGKALNAPSGAVIFNVGEPAEGVYIVRSGLVDVQLLSSSGLPVWSRCMGENAILGLPAAIGGYPHHIRAVARETSELIFVRRETLTQLVEHDTRIGARVLELISEELRDLRRKVVIFNSAMKSSRKE